MGSETALQDNLKGSILDCLLAKQIPTVLPSMGSETALQDNLKGSILDCLLAKQIPTVLPHIQGQGFY